MTQHNFSQAALGIFNSEKSKWAEIQFINALDQLLASEENVKKLRTQLDEANKRIDELVNEKGKANGD